MNEKKKYPLNVLFTKEERDLLRQIATRDSREEGPEIKWLIAAYANGLLVETAHYNRVMEMFQKRLEEVDKKLTALDQEQSGLAKSLRGGKGPADLREPPGESRVQDSTTRLNLHSKQSRRQSE